MFRQTRSIWIAGTVLLVVVLTGIVIIFSTVSRQPEMSQEEAAQQVLGQYKGEIVSTEKESSHYVIQLKAETGLYELSVAKDGSGITSVRSLERYAAGQGNPANVNGPSEKPPDNEAPPASIGNSGTQPLVFISEDKAVQIALGKAEGNVKDIDLDRKKGTWYYFIEIKTPDGREAVVQLSAAAGKVESVSWDDDDD